jgi:hypothetical protein
MGYFVQVTVGGSQGHAGTFPMLVCWDPIIAAAGKIVLMKNICNHSEKYISYWRRRRFLLYP